MPVIQGRAPKPGDWPVQPRCVLQEEATLGQLKGILDVLYPAHNVRFEKTPSRGDGLTRVAVNATSVSVAGSAPLYKILMTLVMRTDHHLVEGNSSEQEARRTPARSYTFESRRL